MSSTTVNLFLQASREQLRFESNAGLLTTEDLWALSLDSLNTIGLKIDARLKESTGSLLKSTDSKKTKARAADELRLEIIKAIIEIRETEAENARARRARETQLAFMRDLRSKKDAEKLEALSSEELDKQIKELEAAG